MKRTVLFIIIICGSLLTGAQQFDCNCSSNNQSYEIYLKNLLITREYSNRINYFQGEQYFNNWAQGEVILINGDTISNINLRYNMYLDELLWLRTSDFQTGVLKKSIVSGFTVPEAENQSLNRFIKKKIKLPGRAAFDAYLEVITEGDIDFYAYRNVIRAVSESRVIDNTVYYICMGDDRVYTIRLNKKSLIHLPGIDSDLMKTIIRTNRIIFRKNEANVAAAVRLYNKAISQ